MCKCCPPCTLCLLGKAIAYHCTKKKKKKAHKFAAFPPPFSRIGYDILLFSRPKLYQLLLSKVPLEKIHYSKKVLSTMQNKEGVMIRCADGTTYHGDVLVGADGAYSGVRQSMYKNLQQQNSLPASDAKELSKGYLCMVGTTDPMDPEQFPYVKNEECTFSQIIGRGTSYNVSLYSSAHRALS